MLQNRVGVSVSLRVCGGLGSKHTPVCVPKLMLKCGVSTLQPDLDDPRCGFHMFNDRGILGEQEQGEMVRLSWVGEGCDLVGISHAGIDMVQCFISPCGARDILIKLWENRS